MRYTDYREKERSYVMLLCFVVASEKIISEERKDNGLDSSFLATEIKVGTSSISIIWEFVRNAVLGRPPDSLN